MVVARTMLLAYFMITLVVELHPKKSNSGPSRLLKAPSPAHKAALSPEYHIVHRKKSESGGKRSEALIFAHLWGSMSSCACA